VDQKTSLSTSSTSRCRNIDARYNALTLKETTGERTMSVSDFPAARGLGGGMRGARGGGAASAPWRRTVALSVASAPPPRDAVRARRWDRRDSARPKPVAACSAARGAGGGAGGAGGGRVGAAASRVAVSLAIASVSAPPQPWRLRRRVSAAPVALVAPRRRRRASRTTPGGHGAGAVFSAGLSTEDGRARTHTDVVVNGGAGEVVVEGAEEGGDVGGGDEGGDVSGAEEGENVSGAEEDEDVSGGEEGGDESRGEEGGDVSGGAALSSPYVMYTEEDLAAFTGGGASGVELVASLGATLGRAVQVHPSLTALAVRALRQTLMNRFQALLPWQLATLQLGDALNSTPLGDAFGGVVAADAAADGAAAAAAAAAADADEYGLVADGAGRVSARQLVDRILRVVGRCRLVVSKPKLKAPLVSALETKI